MGHGPAHAVTGFGEPPAIDTERGGELRRPRPLISTGRPAASSISALIASALIASALTASAPVASALFGSTYTTAGAGVPSLPGHGGDSAEPPRALRRRRPPSTDGPVSSRDSRDSRESPHGTRRICSAQPLPPARTAVITASGPRRPWTRANALAARASDSADPPQKPSWRPVSGWTSSGTRRRRVSPADGVPLHPWVHPWAPPVPANHPSSCQRVLSARAPALSAPS